ncbi:hypothetical protein BGZ99_001241 [Dissophora globulifera]|uniref:RhoGAP-domain-containing protein n=1 Tax=Dissophora globulifera TaxID=979702 RepID=A0A9P6RYQ5_9FUNG|nr:hypothetical protein BGZ99_001241 [Dissophora globulifera]
MSQSTRSDQSLSQGQAPDLNRDATLHQVTTERNSLRSQNDQLWKLIEKQRLIIQNLQKDIAKVTSERDLLRHMAAESDNFRNGTPSTALAQANGHHQPSKRSMERRPQQDKTDRQEKQETEAATATDADKDTKLASVISSSFSSSASSTSELVSQSDQLTQQQQQQQSPQIAQQPDAAPLTPSSHFDGDSAYEESKIEESRPSVSQEADDETGSQASYDPEIQVATAGNRFQQPTQSGQNQSPSTLGSPASGRNISANLSLGPLATYTPHPPPRSPRRERRDAADIASSPAASDNEDESLQSSQGHRKKGASPLSQSQSQEDQDQTSHIVSASKVPMTRSTISGQILAISPSATHSTGGQNPSPLTPLLSANLESPASPSPVSPIAAIIDQDAEKFRIYMTKLAHSNRKNVSAPIQINGGSQDHATALGQAVAIENIQNQIEIQNQLLGQLPSHSGREDLSLVHGGIRSTVSAPIKVPESQISTGADGTDYARTEYGRISGDINDSSFTDSLDKNSSQLSLPLESRSRKRDSSVPVLDEYPKIAARSTSHQRGIDEDSTSGHGMPPVLPKRFESQQQQSFDQSQGDMSRTRVASPTPSANSSMANTLTGGQPSVRSSQTLHQQNFSMFSDNLDFVSILVVGSNISTNDKGKEQLTFSISIGQEMQGEHDDSRYPHKEEDELWRVEKQYIDFISLDSKLRFTQSRNIVNSLPKLPDKSLFSTHAPSKVDARKLALEQYLQSVTSLRIKDTRDLCEFLSTNVVERGKRKDVKGPGWKEGYLTKRGKNFGGWKTRYFMLRGPVLEYFDTKDGHNLGSIALTNSQIGRQQSQEGPEGGSSKDGSTDPNSYRHAFLILEPKKGQVVIDAKKNPHNVVRHVLCAETDQERDAWVDALMLYVGKDPATVPEGSERDKSGRKLPETQKPGATPTKDIQTGKGGEKTSSSQDGYEKQPRTLPTSHSTPQLSSQGRGIVMPQSPTVAVGNMEERQSIERPSVEGPNTPTSRGAQQPYLPRNPSSQSLPQEDISNFSLSPEMPSAPAYLSTEAAEKKKSRMTFWPKKASKDDSAVPMPASSSSSGQQSGQQPSGSTPPAQQDASRLRNFLGKGSSNSSQAAGGGNMTIPAQPGGSQPQLAPIRQVFGVTLEEAIEQAVVQPGYELPAVVYRCIEYLNAHRAKLEEGIYRLNGSTAVIKSLKERFNHDGDLALLQEDVYYDIHAVAGLLKLFLRELPSSVLTRELHKDFLQVIELPNRSDRVDELTRLVASLPEANYTILRALTAHLIEIVDNADVNKMTARNVGIVFSPTLGIPAGVFALLMSDFDQIFHTSDGRIMPLENSDAQEQGQGQGQGHYQEQAPVQGQGQGQMQGQTQPPMQMQMQMQERIAEESTDANTAS